MRTGVLVRSRVWRQETECAPAWQAISAVRMTVISALYPREDFGELERSAMACIIAEIVLIVGESRGSMKRLESGVMELRLATGEIFLLGEETITRVA